MAVLIVPLPPWLLFPQDLESLTRWKKQARRVCESEMVRSTDKHDPAEMDKDHLSLQQGTSRREPH